MDPQQRLLLEVTWEALEDAGIAADQLRGSRTGVFIGMMAGGQYGSLQVDVQGGSCLDDPYFGLGVSASVAAGRISYVYDLRGPSLTLDTACSSALVALHMAAGSIRNGDCEVAVVGGVSAITHPDLFRQGCKMRMLARDGRCKTFDAAADGFALGEGCGVVILERAERAAGLGRRPLAALRGSAASQDGASNGLTAPNGAAQVAVITQALARAGLRPADLDYVEAHGSGTLLGDTIEVGAIQQALGPGRDVSRPVVVGAVKTNVGHLIGAAGIAGLIKTVLALRHGQVPANLHLATPNPGIDWDAAPVLLPAAAMPWPEAGTGTAGVSSFGWSGTNAHVILERPAPARPDPVRPGPGGPGEWQLLPLSAVTDPAIGAVAGNLAGHLRAHPETSLADTAFTLQSGRSALRVRAAVVCRDAGGAVRELEAVGGRTGVRAVAAGQRPRVSFLLPGAGEQYPGMAGGLYRAEPVFRAAVDSCAAAAGACGVDLAEAFRVPAGRLDEAHAAVFAADYACAALWRHWGAEPSALLGYSLGEYVAACLAGVFALEDAIGLVIRRARLVMEAPAGAMTAVALPAAAAARLLPAGLSVAALNGPMTTVVAGPAAGMAELERGLGARGIAHRRLRTDRAMHSAMLEDLRGQVAALVDEVPREVPRMPFVSNLTGTWITAGQARDPGYWAAHMCGTVRFADGVGALMAEGGILLEAGPGNLRSLAAQILAGRGEQPAVVATLRAAADPADDRAFILRAAGSLWTRGVPLDWRAMRGERPGHVTSLPTYPFEHQRFWPAAGTRPAAAGAAAAGDGRLPEDAWLNAAQWQQQEASGGMPAGPFLLLADSLGVAGRLAGLLAEFGACTIVTEGASFEDNGGGRFTVRPDSRADYAALAERLAAGGGLPRTVVHLWGLTGDQPDGPDELSQDTVRLRQRLGFASLTGLAVALAGRSADGVRVLVATDRARRVEPGEPVAPGKATLAGPCLTLPQEYPGLACRTVDLPALAPRADEADGAGLAGYLMTELGWPGSDVTIAYRSGRRLVRRYAAVAAPGEDRSGLPLRDGGVYLITGGLGQLGLVFARHIAGQAAGPRLILLSRGGLPAREDWDRLLAGGADAAEAGRVRAVLELEQLGATVLPRAGDVSDPAAMSALVEEIHDRFGPLNGVVHGAGITSASGFAMAAALTGSSVAGHFAAKVYGTLVLSDVLSAEPLDFCLLQSSMSAELGGLGFTAYAAANAFLASFPDAVRGDGAAAWQSVCWDTWQSTLEQASSAGIGAALADHAMTDDEGLRALGAVYRSGRRGLIVSTAGLAARRAQWVPGGDPLAGADPLAGSADIDASAAAPARADYERRLAALWREALGTGHIGLHDNFFELGGNSLIGLQLMNSIKKEFRVAVSVVALFEAPTVAAMARYLLPGDEESQSTPAAPRLSPSGPHAGGTDIAVIGMAGRFPGAGSVDRFWQNLRDGVESITFFTEEELVAQGLPEELVRHSGYVPARPVIDGVEEFDAEFFGYTPWDARLTDPQQRLFLECVWEALESAGYPPLSHPGSVGVFGGANISTYLRRVYEDPDTARAVNEYQIVISNDKDALTTNVSYRLNLRGPSVAVQTFCSTSLVAVHMAARALIGGECDTAVAGGVSVRVPDRVGHLYTEGGMETPDGHVRTFDADARGAIFGDGVAVVVLRRLADAIADGDDISAVIKGSAINNDGSLKVGFTAPSVRGQAAVITRALQAADVDPATISYVEAHGTATELGDPIEIAALSRAFGDSPERQSCAIGSVKTNVGHLDRAAGATGLIKTVLALKHRQIPPTLHFRTPNPEIDFAASPFFVNSRLRPWEARAGAPRRAGVSSLGMGGTNAHVVVEEAPPGLPGTPPRRDQVLLLSARTPDALEQAAANLARHLTEHPELPLEDVAYTLQVGRDRFEHRRAWLCRSPQEAIQLLAGSQPRRSLRASDPVAERPVAFVLAGVGEQYPGLAAGLYAHEPVFRSAIDDCADTLLPRIGSDVRDLLFTGDDAAGTPGPDLGAMLGRTAGRAAAPAGLTRTAVLQPAMFALDYALATLLMDWGVRPEAMLGYSLGEYVAACLAGVFSLPDALALVAERARLIDELPEGAMTAIARPASALAGLLGPGLDIAALNGPASCVVAGTPEAVAELERRLTADGVAARRLDTSHAFHSRMLAPAAASLTAWIRASIQLSEPRVPYLSNVTGTWITAADVADPGYWARHMCAPVRFAEGTATLLASPGQMLVEIGPGQSLGALIRSHQDFTAERSPLITGTLPARHDKADDLETVHNALARAWLRGVPVDWAAYHAGGRRHRVPLPTYPFQRKRHWIDAPAQAGVTAAGAPLAGANGGQDVAASVLGQLPKQDAAHWYYVPGWRQLAPVTQALDAAGTWLILAGQDELGDQFAVQLASAGGRAVLVGTGSGYQVSGPDRYTVAPDRREDYLSMLADLGLKSGEPLRVLHLWGTGPAAGGPGLEPYFFSLLALSQALGEAVTGPRAICVVGSGAVDPLGDGDVDPAKATMLGPVRVMALEQAGLRCRYIDVCAGPAGSVAAAVLREIAAAEPPAVVALRGPRRWVPEYNRIDAPPRPAAHSPFYPDGVYLITGGLGGIGLAMGRAIAADVGARLVLVGRNGLPDPGAWDRLLAAGDTDPELARRIRAVRDIEALGCEVLVLAADVARLDDMREAFAQALGTFGRLDGVVHAAGLPGTGLMQFKTREAAGAVLAAKVEGTRVLRECMAGLDTGFLVLFSSTAALTGGGPGQADYCAANAYLDAVAQAAARQPGPRTVAINWGEWQWNAWDMGLAGFDPAITEFLRKNRERIGIGFDEGWEALRQAVALGEPQVVVSSQDINALAELTSSLGLSGILSAAAPGTRQARPDLASPFVAPEGDEELRVARLWSAALGIDGIGMHDSFFDLGGNSLLGVDLVMRMRVALGRQDLPPHILYEAPTIAEVIAYSGGAADDGLSERERRGAARRAAQLRCEAAGAEQLRTHTGGVLAR